MFDLITIERFLSHVAKGEPDECWEWKLSCTGLAAAGQRQYGQFRYKGRALRAHRVAWAIANGVGFPDPATVVAHTCDNPPCCNPAHLRAGSQADNMHDCRAKRRDRNSRKTACLHGHEFTAESTIWRGERRQCRICASEASARRYRARMADQLSEGIAS